MTLSTAEMIFVFEPCYNILVAFVSSGA